MRLSHPFRTTPLSGPDVGWFRPATALLLAMIVPTLISLIFTFIGTPKITGLPKDGTGYTFANHVEFVLAFLSASFLVSWMIAPFALLSLRASAMLGYAGWGTAVLMSLGCGLPIVHFALNGDLTTDYGAFVFLPHISIAISFLGLSVWAAFWGLMKLRQRA